MEELYSQRNLDRLAALVVKTWRPTEKDEDSREIFRRANYLAGNNRHGWMIMQAVGRVMGGLCALS